MHVDPPQRGMANDEANESDSKWVGPCPPDMQAGNVVMGHRKFNILKGPKSGPPPG